MKEKRVNKKKLSQKANKERHRLRHIISDQADNMV